MHFLLFAAAFEMSKQSHAMELIGEGSRRSDVRDMLVLPPVKDADSA